jgi:hypothetical protein
MERYRTFASTLLNGRRNGMLLTATMVLVFLQGITARAQVIIQGTYDSNTGNQLLNPNNAANYTSTVIPLINPCQTASSTYQGQTCAWPINSKQWPEPQFTFSVEAPYNTTSYDITWYLDSSYKDKAGFANTTSQSTVLAGNQSWSPTWNSHEFGGSVAVKAEARTTTECKGGIAGTLNFNIWGANQAASPQLQDAAAQYSAPWFMPNIIAQESGGLQFGYYSKGAFHSDKQPIWGAPDGIGVMQVDREPNPSYFTYEDPYWDFEVNVQDGIAVLNSKQQSSASPCNTNQGEVTNRACTQYAYDFWDRQVYQACVHAGGSTTASRSGGPGTETCNKTVTAAPTTSYTYCQFSYPLTTADAYKDADWIQTYNGVPCGYFISWNNTQGQWQVTASQTCHGKTYSYVKNVCNATPVY